MNRTMGSSSPYRQPNMTFWSRSYPVIFPHVKTDHWSKMKNKVPTFKVSMPAAAFLGKGSRYSFGAYKTALGLPSLKARG
ncbi:hypothetical protein HHUSO_G26254 [Huso huso]|uniref:Uncharacterized protein n=1 Tax=Huso huso TaxID=61971 RepID=A0ABR0YNB1_HUSHU